MQQNETQAGFTANHTFTKNSEHSSNSIGEALEHLVAATEEDKSTVSNLLKTNLQLVDQVVNLAK
eukprot:2855468-Ditylum_brightwellii.AAC.1